MGMPELPKQVKIVEVGPRDGLQNEPEPIATEDKLRFIQGLADSGLKHIEATSFVHPKAIPQLADALEVVKQLPPVPGVIYSALVPNMKGLERAIESGIRRIAVFTAASNSFTQKNIQMSIRESLETFKPVVGEAMKAGISVRGYVSTAFVCPYEGDIAPEAVLDITAELLAMGVDEVSLGDTIGAASPKDVYQTIGLIIDKLSEKKIALHFHDTFGTALANVYTGLELGITTFDSSAGGLGGCPYAPGASGNLATEDLVYMLNRMGITTGVDLEKLSMASRGMETVLKRDLPSKQLKRLKASIALKA
jgi:hydroxymethylglutaryl-CoA lyase